MTLFGWDASHYDGLLSTAILARAKAEGVEFFTHKIGEGTSIDDPGDRTALAAAKAAGIEFIGGYYVVRSGDVGAQVDNCIRLLDRDEPWWRTFPGFFLQVDLERWPYDSVPASTGINFGNALRDATGRCVVLYASRGQYGDALRAWGGPLWNADYGSNPVGSLRAVYPGDQSRGWTAYSGRTPDILQFGSRVTIGGLSTCDGNAFRGSLSELRTLIQGDDDMTLRDDPDGLPLLSRVADTVAMRDTVSVGANKLPEPNQLVKAINAIKADVADLKARPATQPVDPAAVARELLAQSGGSLNVTVTDDQFERVLRRVLGSVDGASPAGGTAS